MASIVDRHGNIPIFGQLSWANFVDWLVTFCVGAIIILTALNLGGVRPDTQVILLPLYTLLLCMHGLWLAVDRSSPKRLSHIPLWFVPALLWMLCSILWVSPVKWLGWLEMIYALQAFILLWVLSNNLRTRAHLWALLLIILFPSVAALYHGFNQFFQDPASMAGAMIDYPLRLNSEFLGRATGTFADPNSFAAFMLMLMPLVLVAAAVKRLPIILRIFCLYVGIMFFFAIAISRTYWAALMVVLLLAIIPWFCYRKYKVRFRFSLIGVLLALVVFAGSFFFHPLFEKGLRAAATVEGEGVRLVLWQEALAMFAADPITGVGAGAYATSFQQSANVSLPDSPSNPHNDYLLILSQFGVVGAASLALPILIVLISSVRAWKNEPFALKLSDRSGMIMPPQRFFMTLGIVGVVALSLCMMVTFVFYVPALMLYGVMLFSILIKTAFNRRIRLPGHWLLRALYFLVMACAGWSFYVFGSYKLEAQGLELRARQQLDHLVEMRVHVSGNEALLDDVVLLFEDSLLADERNVDAWIGLSSATCQKYYRNPSLFREIGARAVSYAKRAVDLSPHYWMAWAQLGVANSFYGDLEAAEESLAKAVELAPQSSNAHYYYSAFLGADSSRRDEALRSVRTALEINPNNSAARRLEQKLLIF